MSTRLILSRALAWSGSCNSGPGSSRRYMYHQRNFNVKFKYRKILFDYLSLTTHGYWMIIPSLCIVIMYFDTIQSGNMGIVHNGGSSITLHKAFDTRGGDTQYKRTLWGCVSNMDNKICLLVNEQSLKIAKIWYMNWVLFQNLAKFESKLAQIVTTFSTIWRFWWKFSPKFDQLVYEWVAFTWNIGICMGLLSNSVAAHPYQNQTWVPPMIYYM